MPFDSAAHSITASGLTAQVTISTNQQNDVVVLMIRTGGGPVVGISDTAGLSWLPRAAVGASGNVFEEWYAIAPSVLTSDVITMTRTSDAGNPMTIDAIAVSDVHLDQIWDSSATLPAKIESPPDFATINVDHTTSFVLGGFDMSVQGNGGGAGYVVVSNVDGVLTEFKVCEGQQVGLVVDQAGGGTVGRIIADALTQIDIERVPRARKLAWFYDS